MLKKTRNHFNLQCSVINHPTHSERNTSQSEVQRTYILRVGNIDFKLSINILQCFGFNNITDNVTIVQFNSKSKSQYICKTCCHELILSISQKSYGKESLQAIQYGTTKPEIYAWKSIHGSVNSVFLSHNRELNVIVSVKSQKGFIFA